MDIIDEGRIFKDRKDAGTELDKVLERKFKEKDALVLGIPHGGVVVVREVSKIVSGEFSVVITKKLPHSLQEELAIGAAAEDGSFYLSPLGKNMDRKVVQRFLTTQEKAIQNAIRPFRKGKPLPEMKNRIVILTDDGIPPVSTIVSAIQLCKKRNAARAVVTAPVSAEQYVSEINELADEVTMAEQSEMFWSGSSI